MLPPRWLFPAAALLLFLAQGLWFAGTQSLTCDEPAHIQTGLDIWQSGRFDRSTDHPPLARLLFALPLLSGNWPLGFDGVRQNAWNDHSARALLAWSPPHPEAIAWRVRPVNLALGALLALLLWNTARRLFSDGAANLVLLLFAFSPALIAHFSLATTDGAGTLLIFATAVQLVRWRRDPSRLQTVLLGLALGGLLVAKFYAPPLFALTLGLVLILKPKGVVWRPRQWNWRPAAAMAVIAFLPIWAAYRFHVSTVSLRGGQLSIQSPGASGYKLAALPLRQSLSVPLPAGEYFTGFLDLAKHSRFGHPSFFLGKVSSKGGWKLYYPVVILLKWPTAALLICLATLALLWRRRIPCPRDLKLIALFPALFLLLSLLSSIDIGDRHILPVYVFALLCCGGIWEAARSRRAALAVVGALAIFQVADCLRYAPDYLSYFNIFVKPERSYRLLSDSNLDWGQGLIALRKYEAEHPREQIHLVYFGPVFPAQYGVRALPLREDERAVGTVAISATHLTGQLLRRRGSYDWLLRYPRKALVNHTLHLFDVSAEPLR